MTGANDCDTQGEPTKQVEIVEESHKGEKAVDEKLNYREQERQSKSQSETHACSLLPTINRYHTASKTCVSCYLIFFDILTQIKGKR